MKPKPDFNRGTGLLIIEVVGSNPNGDPDLEGAPRTIGADQKGLISPVSVKRKLRDLVADGDGPAMQTARDALKLDDAARRYGILESRGRRREEIGKMARDEFVKAYWDARLFGNTFLEALSEETKKADKKNKTDRSHFISTGAVQVGPGISVAPIEIERGTLTNKAGVEGDKDRGMAPLAWQFVPHGIYAMPFFVNPMVAGKSGCTKADVDLMLFLLPYVYRATASVARPDVDVLHAWYATHRSPLGSCPDWRILDAMRPSKRADPDRPSTSRAEYDIPDALPEDIHGKLDRFEDLCEKDWSGA
jgi:Cas7 group CRISPR-associated protein Csh2